ncbi:MAG TPA: hypothetical protein VGN72_18050 [Tepidisphaeraceae bacterium]|nr:hypothetical protein [Tepidisphaeraceae bacterium]
MLPATWLITSHPLWAVVTLTIVGLLGFGPALRRAYWHPHDEHAGFFTLSAVRNLFVLFALERYTVTTVLFPAAVAVACLMLVILLICRRSAVGTGAR